MWFLIFALLCRFSSGERCLDSDAIHFPEQTSAGGELVVCNYSRKLVRSLQIARHLNTLHSIDDYLKQVHELPSIDLLSRFSEDVMIAKPALCMPENQTVRLMNDPNPSFLYIPAFTRVKRCGGGCTIELLSCRPTETRFIKMQLLKTSVEDTGLKYVKKIIVPVEEHTKCECDCKVEANQCTEKQKYIEDECRCQCQNIAEAEECQMRKGGYKWDRELCQCQEVRKNQINICRC